MNYHDLLISHLFSMFILTSSSLLSLFHAENKSFKALSGLGSLLTIISGMLLMKRFGISHAGPFPLWIWFKIAIWLVISVGTPVIVKRRPSWGPKVLFPFFLLVLAAIAFAVYKPL